MASSALEIVSLETMRSELELASDDDFDDDSITIAITDAVSFVAYRIGLPLIAVTETLRCYLPTMIKDDVPIYFEAKAVTAVNQIGYYLTTQKQREEPTGVIAGNALGRHVKEGRFDIDNWIFPPATNWPEMLEVDRTREVHIEVAREFAIDDKNRQIRSAVILAARDIYNGQRESYGQSSAFENLIIKYTT